MCGDGAYLLPTRLEHGTLFFRASLRQDGNLPDRVKQLSHLLRSIWGEESNRGQRVRRVLTFFGWQFWKRLIRRPRLTTLFNGLQFRAYPDCAVSAGALYMRIPDSKDILFLRKHINGGTFLDVGANVGLITLLIADNVQHCILFEPNPIAARRAKENLAINGLNFEVYAAALSDRVGTVELEHAGAVDTCNRTVEGFKSSLPTITVPRTTFEQFLRERGPLPAPVCAVKIDVEGHENSVLRGMLRFLSRERPKLVMFEYLQRTNISETLDLFEQAGYTVFALSSSGPQVATVRVSPLQNLFACPREIAREFSLTPEANTTQREAV